MNYETRILPEVEDDLVVTYNWYERKSSGLGEDFLLAFYSDALELEQTPLAYAVFKHDFRRRLMRRFPYGIYYRIDGGQIVVLACFHCARDPKTIGATLSDRGGSQP
jgi:toxin ParE1/3/4